MKKIWVLVYLIASLAQAEEGFIDLFDGKSLDGWTAAPGGTWEVADGAILGRSPASEKRHGILFSNKSYENFVVRAKFKVTKGDSGFYFRSERVNRAVNVNGFQVEVDSSQETGGLYETGGRAWVIKPKAEDIPNKKYKPGEWSDLEVRADHKDITVKINGVITAHLKNDSGRMKGFFGLQLHGNLDMHVEYKDIRIKEL